MPPSEHWFWGVIARYSKLYGHVLVSSLIVNALTLAMPLFIMNVYDRIVPNNAFESLWVLAIGMFIASGLDFFLRIARIRFVDIAGRNADVQLQNIFMHSLMQVRLDFLYMSKETGNVGALIARVRELEYVRNFLGSRTILVLTDIPFILLFIFFMFYLGGNLGFIPLCAIPVLLLVPVLMQKICYRASQNTMRTNAEKQSFLSEIATSFETIRATRMEEPLLKTWNEKTAKAADAHIHSTALSMMTSQGMALFNICLTVLVVIAGVYRISEGLMTTGGLIACVILFGRIAAPLSALLQVLADLQQTTMTLKRMGRLMAMPKENPDEFQNLPEQALTVPISLEKVGFCYPSGSEKNIQMTALKDITMIIQPGAKLGFVGASGSGKSTLARLFAGLYTPTEGRIMLGRVNMLHMPMRPFRNRIGFLPQEIRIFQGTVRHNIALAWPHASPYSQEDIIQAATIAGVMDFVSDHPLGLDMPVGERGVGLSGGQAQCVALARALLGNPHTIILDEPAAQLDDASSYRFVQRILPFIKDKTLIIFTHKPVLLQLVHTVAAMEKGKIIWSKPTSEVLNYDKQERSPVGTTGSSVGTDNEC